jgi:hypothetical protein
MALWKNKKFGKKTFIGCYVADRRSERNFVLINGDRHITFESFQAAKALGWTKIK